MPEHAPIAASTYRVTAVALHVRDAPAITGKVIGYLHRGNVVERLGASKDGYWLHVRQGGLAGWASHKYLEGVAPPSGEHADPPWLQIALAERGVKEIHGARDNPRVLEYLRSTNLPRPLAAEDETSWCSAFVNWCVERAGFEGTDSAWARSWLHWGRAIAKPQRGCIVVLARGGPESGHVGFCLGDAGEDIELLGGNQKDSVSVARFPKSQVLGCRLPG
jgi:uncharacterized protein (TIGR02594 family)